MDASPELTDIRPSPIAGMWYPGAADQLAAQIDRYLAEADAATPATAPSLGAIVGIMAPHAGYRYSGPVAAHAFRLVRGMAVETVAVVSPIHRPASRAPVFTTAHQAYMTPLGLVRVDHAAIEAVRAAANVPIEATRHDQEHALEIELPFLQRVLDGDFTLTPLMLSDQSARTAERVGRALAKALRGRRALLVASTDLSHFYDQRTANHLDSVVLDRVAAFDPEGVIAVEDEGRGFACGRGAVAAVMWAARDLGADAAAVVNYATSGDTSGDYTRVVGYGAAVFYKRG
ncbi:MAG: AmmeMemoRadiSam system protein B [Anaerolineae bacterium]